VPTDPQRRSPTWKRSTIWAILHNPKYTGYQVWNRRASKTGHGRRNQPDQWTWSQEPSHPPIVTVEEFQRVDAVAEHKRRSRRSDAPPARPTTRAPYLLRGNPAGPDHPHTVYVPERALLDGVTGFLRTAVYGPERAGYWTLALQRAQARTTSARQHGRASPSWRAPSPTCRRACDARC
jgi:site-specific DNA recombinase